MPATERVPMEAGAAVVPVMLAVVRLPPSKIMMSLAVGVAFCTQLAVLLRAVLLLALLTSPKTEQVSAAKAAAAKAKRGRFFMG